MRMTIRNCAACQRPTIHAKAHFTDDWTGLSWANLIVFIPFLFWLFILIDLFSDQNNRWFCTRCGGGVSPSDADEKARRNRRAGWTS